MKTNEYNTEYTNPNEFFDITFQELQNKIERLRLDTIQTNDPEVKAFAEKRYLEARIAYFKLLNDDLTLQKLYEQSDIEVDEDV